MAELAGFEVAFAAGFTGAVAEVAAVLDERARRLLLGAAARRLGRGGITLVAAASGVSVDTVGKGAAELEAGIVADGRVRAKGAGRKPVEHTDPGLWPALDALVDPESRGDPMSALRWTTKSTVKLADELTAHGHRVGPGTVARLLKDHDYSLQGNAKTLEGTQHPDRDAQFRYLNDQVSVFLAEGSPVISVDTKKKELVGTYRNGGREYQRSGEPVKVNTYDFIGEAGKAVPYGVYDVAANSGWVNVGTDADTGEFAVESIRRWWNRIGAPAYPDANRLLITADGGGSNGSRLRGVEDPTCRARHRDRAADHRRAPATGNLEVEPGRAPPVLRDHHELARSPPATHEVVVETIAATTTTTTGLTVAATLDTNTYQRGIKITDKEMKAFEARHLHRHDFHGNWNYTIRPEPPQETTRPGEPT